MNSLTLDLDAASSVSKTNQGRVRSLERGPRPTAHGHLKRKRWKEKYSKIDVRSSDSKLWRIVKRNRISSKSNSGMPTGRLNFKSEDRTILKRARNVIHGCRSSDLGDPELAKSLSSRELLIALTLLDLNKSPKIDDLHGQILKYLHCREIKAD
ncbi:hypothetical protein TNCV_4519681 [Trichonephila clavipes]|nr:hypothetical protein TNCV_4519681 [Trichonephila clavipes]